MNTSQSSLTRSRTLHVLLHQTSRATLFLRPGPSPGAWAPTSFLSRADQVSLSLVNAARSSSGDITRTKQTMNGIICIKDIHSFLRLGQFKAIPTITFKKKCTCCPEW